MILDVSDLRIVSAILRSGNSSKLSELGSDAKSIIKTLIDSHIMGFVLDPDNTCPKCLGPMDNRLGLALVCLRCGNQIELSENEVLEKSIFSVEMERTVSALRDNLQSSAVRIEPSVSPDIFSTVSIGRVLSKDEKSYIELYLISRPLNLTLIYALIGHAILENTHCIIFHCMNQSEISSDLEMLAFPRILPLSLEAIALPEIDNHIDRFALYTDFQTSVTNSVSEIIQTRQNIALTSSEITFLQEVTRKSLDGAQSFEPLSLRLLQPLGVTSRFESGGYGPDGMLYLPDSFYIVDAKSTQSHFKFQVSERDKIHRYIRTMEENQKWFDSYQFRGEIIITRSLPSPVSKVLDKVETYFQKNKILGKIIIISVEGLIDLYSKVCKQPEFFRRIDYKKHIDSLFEKSFERPESGNVDSYETIRYLNESVMNNLFQRVMESPLLDMGGRGIGYLDTLVYRAFQADK